MKVLVLGAGVIGVSSAYYLARAGHEVTVIERQSGPGLETSFANGGQISASHADPWAGPATPAKILKWLGKPDAPLLYRFRFDPRQWTWGLRFLLSCTAARNRVNTERILRVAVYSREVLRELRAATGISYDHLTRGILHVYSDAREFEQAVPKAALMSDLGCTRKVMTPAECVAVEPALAGSRDTLVGGTFSPDDESGDAYAFTCRLAELAAASGVTFRYGSSIEGLETEGDRVVGVRTAEGRLTADSYLSAIGSYNTLLMERIGIRLPVYPAKGYSVTIPVAGHGGAPSVAIIDDERKIVYSRLGDRLRVAGTAELTGYDTTLRDERVRPILNAAMRLFPDCGDAAKAEFWTGLRPTTPDSVPVIGPTRYRNLFLNTGHGTLGWTMACGSGRLIADIVSGRPPDISVEGLDVSRYKGFI